MVIPNYNARDMLAQCLTSIYANPPRHSLEVLVIDDASSDDSAELVRARFPNVRLLVNERNRGQSVSNNRAARESTGRLLHFVNNDIEFHPGAIDALATFLDGRPDVGATGSLLFNPDGSLQGAVKPLPSARTALFGRRSYISKLFPGNRFSRQEVVDWRSASGEPFEIGFVHGASLMLRRDAYFAAGGFDVRLFNFDDADLCKRIHDLGLKVYCIPASKVTHYEHGGGSGYSVRQRFWRVWRFHQDVWRYFRKHHSRGAWDPMNLLVSSFLVARFIASFALQLVRETKVPIPWLARTPRHSG
jgi:GT2 family glycosyltransferase